MKVSGVFYFFLVNNSNACLAVSFSLDGPTLTYNMNDRLKIDFSSLITSLTQSDFLDASDMTSQPKKDRFRTVSIGLSYSIN